jgi:hypothetical protein
MIIEVKNKDIFIPVYGGNDKQPEGEQIKVHHRFLLPGERKKYIYTRPVKVDKLKGKVDSNVEAVQDEEGIARAIITSIENLEIKCGDDIVKVDTVEKMYNTLGVPKYLVSEIEVNMLLVSPVVDAEFIKKP